MVDGMSMVTLDVMGGGAAASPSGPGQVTVFDVARFDSLQQQAANMPPSPAVQAVDGINGVDSNTHGFKNAMQILQSLNGNTETLGVQALSFSAGSGSATPGEILQLTMHAHHFLFQSELTANVANKTSDGIQQLFRQQS